LSTTDNVKEKKEILFYYESRQNPNGDPGFDNQPRIMPDGTIMVTDVRIKRTMRDYAKKTWDVTLFVDFGEDGNPITADKRAKEIISPDNKNKKLEGDVIKRLLELTFDVPLFGALIPIRTDKDDEGGTSQKLTGPLQFGIGRSINQVQVINPLISSHFVGKVKEGQEQQFSTFGRFYSVEYALIKVHGALNPDNLGDYLEDKDIKKKFIECENRIFQCLWNGTDELVTRSKFPQRSILYIEITYKDTIYNDLPDLVDEREDLKKRTAALGTSPFNFEKLLSLIKKRKDKINKIRVKGCREISADITQLISSVNSIQKTPKLIEEIVA
jgi:CRISPR-associated protein Csh2